MLQKETKHTVQYCHCVTQGCSHSTIRFLPPRSLSGKEFQSLRGDFGRMPSSLTPEVEPKCLGGIKLPACAFTQPSGSVLHLPAWAGDLQGFLGQEIYFQPHADRKEALGLPARNPLLQGCYTFDTSLIMAQITPVGPPCKVRRGDCFLLHHWRPRDTR